MTTELCDKMNCLHCEECEDEEFDMEKAVSGEFNRKTYNMLIAEDERSDENYEKFKVAIEKWVNTYSIVNYDDDNEEMVALYAFILKEGSEALDFINNGLEFIGIFNDEEDFIYHRLKGEANVPDWLCIDYKGSTDELKILGYYFLDSEWGFYVFLSNY